MTKDWKEIKGYEGLYQISNDGNLNSLRKNKLLNYFINNKGYAIYRLVDSSGKLKRVSAHILVWDAFGDKLRDGLKLQVDHIDNNKLNNSIDNLQLLSNRANVSKQKLILKKTSVYTGVYFHKLAKKWVAEITYGKVYKYLGLFSSELKAHLAYQKELNAAVAGLVVSTIYFLTR